MYKIILSIIYIVSFGILFNCSNYLIRYGRTRREIKWFVASLGCVQLWFVSQILIFIATDEIQLKIAYLIGNFGICLIGSSWIKFIFVFKEKKNRIADILVVISLMMYGVICTNKYHSLYYKRFTMDNIIYGKLFYINIIFDYLCVILGIIIIWRNFSNIKNGTKVKVVLSFSVIIPLICNYIYQNIFKDLKFDLTPIGFSITCMFVLLVTFKLNIFNIKDYILNDFIQNTEDGIFILDNNNLPIYYNESFKTIFDIDSAREDILKEINEYGTVTYKRMYGNFTDDSLKPWNDVAVKHAIVQIHQPRYSSAKNASDIMLVIDAMDILYSNTVDGFVIVSSDSDFTRLVARLREAGMQVIGMGETKTPMPRRW